MKRGSTRFWLCASLLFPAGMYTAPEIAGAEGQISPGASRLNEMTVEESPLGKSTRAWAVVLNKAHGASRKQAHGQLNSRSPSTKNGQPLESFYSAFDRAGPDAPQVMEVVWTAPKVGSTGRAAEITLAASSL